MVILSKLADYGVIVTTHLAALAPAQSNAAQIAEATRLPKATVSKLLKLLAHAGLVTASRGAAGGYRLALAPADISIARIVNAIDGGFAVTQCTSVEAPCDRHAFCSTRPHWDRINHAVAQALDGVALSDMLPRRSFLESISFVPSPDAALADAVFESHVP